MKQKQNTPEKKLSVEVGHVNNVHVNHMNETKPRQGLRHNNTHQCVYYFYQVFDHLDKQ